MSQLGTVPNCDIVTVWDRVKEKRNYEISYSKSKTC